MTGVAGTDELNYFIVELVVTLLAWHVTAIPQVRVCACMCTNGCDGGSAGSCVRVCVLCNSESMSCVTPVGMVTVGKVILVACFCTGDTTAQWYSVGISNGKTLVRIM